MISLMQLHIWRNLWSFDEIHYFFHCCLMKFMLFSTIFWRHWIFFATDWEIVFYTNISRNSRYFCDRLIKFRMFYSDQLTKFACLCSRERKFAIFSLDRLLNFVMFCATNWQSLRFFCTINWRNLRFFSRNRLVKFIISFNDRLKKIAIGLWVLWWNAWKFPMMAWRNSRFFQQRHRKLIWEIPQK